MRVFLWLVGLLLTSVWPPLYAAEVDQFSQFRELKDSRAVIEAEVNRRIKVAVRRANDFYPKPQQHKKEHHRKRPRCDANRLYGQLQSQLARPIIGQLESFAEESAQVDKYRVTFQQSIYRDYASMEAPTLVLSERIAAVIRIGEVYMGSDKLGHFFTEGLSYFEVNDRLQDGNGDAIKVASDPQVDAEDSVLQQGFLFGKWSESLYFGAQTTGVFSFADLTANFHGLRFWNRILARQPDPLLRQEVDPYIRCQGTRWQIVQAFNFEDYVDQGWNEAVNCSAFRTEELLQNVLRYQPRCTPEKLPLYDSALASEVLNDQGLRVLPEELQPEILLAERADTFDWKLPAEVIENIRTVRLEIEQWRSSFDE